MKRTYAGSSSFLYGPGGPYLGAPLATRHSKALNIPCTAVQMTIAPEWFLAVSECNMCCEKRPSRAGYIVFVKLDEGWTTDVEQFKTRRHTGITTVPWMTPDNVYTNMCCMVGTAVAWQCQGRGSVGSPCSAQQPTLINIHSASSTLVGHADRTCRQDKPQTPHARLTGRNMVIAREHSAWQDCSRRRSLQRCASGREHLFAAAH